MIRWVLFYMRPFLCNTFTFFYYILRQACGGVSVFLRLNTLKSGYFGTCRLFKVFAWVC